MRVIVGVTVGVLLLCSRLANAQEADVRASSAVVAKPSPAALRAAEEGLETLKRRLVNDRTYRSFGFRQIEDAQQASIGTPIVESVISLEGLLSFVANSPRADLGALLMPGVLMYFPVLVGDEVRSSIAVLRKSEQSWRPALFGGSAQMRAIAAMRKRISREVGVDEERITLVRIPALNLQVLAYRLRDGRAVFVPYVAHPKLGWTPGKPLQAVDAISEIQPMAKRIDRQHPAPG